MREVFIDEDVVVDEDLGEFILDAIRVTVYDDNTFEIQQRDADPDLNSVGMTKKQWEELKKIIDGGLVMKAEPVILYAKTE